MKQQEFQLYVKRGPETGKVYPLESVSISIGRDPMADITINDPEVSRRHALLVSSETGFAIQDLGSTNGTLIDGKRLSGEQFELEAGQVISMGTGVALVFEAITLEDAGQEPPGETELPDSETVILDAAPAPDETIVEPEPVLAEPETVIDGFDYPEPEADLQQETLVETEEIVSPAVAETMLSEQPKGLQENVPQGGEPEPEKSPPIEPVVVPQEGEIIGAEPEKGKNRRTTTIVIATILILCCCCSAFALFMYYYGGDLLLRQLGVTP